MISVAAAEERTGMNELGQHHAITAGDVLHQLETMRSPGAGFQGAVGLAEGVHTGVPFAFEVGLIHHDIGQATCSWSATA
jgi:hypothetical protein